MGFKWNKECYASDYFQKLYEWAVELIKKNKAYVDDQSKEIIQGQRKTPFEEGINSLYRNRSVNENLYLFEKMKNGFFEEESCVLRAKINMKSSNMNMRDPIMYRILKKRHPRTKNEWCIYPTYDWTHGQCDYFEQISHSLCSLEFENRRPLYNWYLDQICESNKIRPKQIEFSRLNLSHTITSKRKIQYLIEKNVISSWDDPRILTISGLRRRGYTSLAINNFIQKIGITKRKNLIDTSLLEFRIREHLNKISPRVMVVLKPIKLVIDNYSINSTEWLETDNNPENQKFGCRKIPFSKFLYIEENDFLEKKVKKFFRLSIGHEVRLKNAYIIKANFVVKDSNGKIKEIHCTYDPTSQSGKLVKNEDKKRVKTTLHWVSIKHSIPIKIYLYYPLFSIKNPDKENFKEHINSKSIEKIVAYAEPSLQKAKRGDRFQFQRIGYFYADINLNNNKEELIFHKTASLKDQWKKINKK